MEKYFIQNDTTGYLVQIFDANFTGVSTEIFGKISFDKGSVASVLDTIRGTGLNLQLEANPLLTFDEFSEADEQTYTVRVTKGSQIVFNGFLKPDGVTQSFVRDIWMVDLDFIDGLGALKDLSFVKSNGFNFVGKISMFEVIEACLARTGLVMTINTFVDVHYLDYAGINILKDTYVNSDRFFKIDDDTIMSCEEVMNSILNLFSACITQQDGQWWIYRPNDFYSNTATFIDNSLNTTFNKKLYKKIGSQIDNYYPHHSGGNQQITTKGAISAYRINYKYGYVSGLLNNSKFVYNNGSYDGWAINTTNSYYLLPATDGSGLNMKMQTQFDRVLHPSPRLIATSNPILLNEGDIFNFKAVLKANTGCTCIFVIKAGSYYMKVTGEWTLTPTQITDIIFGNGSGEGETMNNGLITEVFELQSYPLPANSSVTIDLYIPRTTIDPLLPDTTEFEFYSVDLIPKQSRPEIGEFHTVSRLLAPSSITKENQEIFNGDNAGIIYLGALFKPDKITNTTLWTRKGKLEEKPLLRISAEDDMRIQQKPIKVFTGDIYGEIPYLSIIEINNINGLFMFIEYSYDTDSNITRGKLQQFYTSEVADLNYLLTFDYGNTVKPTIVS